MVQFDAFDSVFNPKSLRELMEKHQQDMEE